MPLTKSHDGVPIVPLYIDGQIPLIDESRLFKVHSAIRGQDVYAAQSASLENAIEAGNSALRAFIKWKATSYTDRRDLLLRVAEILIRRKEELIQYQCEETSCQKTWAEFNVDLACAAIREIASHISLACTGELPPASSSVVPLVYKEPIGPVLAICPWNASIVLSARAIAAPLGAGCTVVFKASELSPRTQHALVEVFVEAGLPAGCLNKLQASRVEGPMVTEALISHKAIRKVEFIGSAAVGKIIGQLAAKHLKPVLMELGGKAPAIVLKDADLSKAASLCALGAFLHHGQICMSTERIIVVEEVADQFVQHLQAEIRTNWATEAGFAASMRFAEHAYTLVEKTLTNGATCVAGSNEWDKKHASLKPIIVTNVKSSDKIFDEESFGPSASLYVVKSEEEAIRLANETSYGLTAAVHSRDVFAALRVAKQLEYGQVHIGAITEYDEACMPIGGVKGSGWGRNNGKYGLREFLIEKTITIHDPDVQLRFG